MSPPPARGWTHLQALLLAEVRAFSARQQLRTVDTRVSTLTGERFVDAAWRQKAAAPLEPEQAEEQPDPRAAAIQKIAALRQHAFRDADICEVLPGLFIGAISAARDLEGLRERGVTHVLNASPVVPCFHKKHLHYHVVQILDDPEAQIHKNFQSCNKFIHKGRRKGGVLVHCYAGQSRSTTLVIAYLLACHQMKLPDALATVRRARPVAQPNSGFMQQLREYACTAQTDHSAQQLDATPAPQDQQCVA